MRLDQFLSGVYVPPLVSGGGSGRRPPPPPSASTASNSDSNKEDSSPLRPPEPLSYPDRPDATINTILESNLPVLPDNHHQPGIGGGVVTKRYDSGQTSGGGGGRGRGKKREERMKMLREREDDLSSSATTEGGVAFGEDAMGVACFGDANEGDAPYRYSGGGGARPKGSSNLSGFYSVESRFGQENSGGMYDILGRILVPWALLEPGVM